MSNANVFHAHLDECERCRNQPFNLCPVGALKLEAAARDDDEHDYSDIVLDRADFDEDDDA